MKVQLTQTESIKINISDLANVIYRFAHCSMNQEDWLEWLNEDTAYEYRKSGEYPKDNEGNIKPEVLRECAIDCRLQAYDGDWDLKFGLSDYDTDHRGCWSYSSIPYACTRDCSRAIARELIEGLGE